MSSLAGIAHAQSPDTTKARVLPTLTVDAVRASTLAPPVATKTVDSLVLRKAQASNVWDLVRRVAGIEIHEQGQGPGFASDAVIRGFTSDHSSDLLLVIDGVPVNLPLHGHVEGYSDWNVLFPAAAAELRVIHGPASPLYGDFSYAGVVEVTTPSTGDGIAGALGGSSFGDASGWLRAGSRGARGGWLAGGRLERSQGWREHDTYWLGNGLLRGQTRLGAGRLDGGVLLYGSSWDSPGFVSVADYNAGRLRPARDLTDGGSAGRVIAHGRYVRPLSGQIGLAALGWAQAGRSTVFLNIPEGDALTQTAERDRRVAAGGQVQISSHSRAGEIGLGISGRIDGVRYRLSDSEARVLGNPLAEFDGSFSSGALFARWRRLVGPILFDAGARLDAQRYARTDLLAGSSHASRTYTLFSPKLGARYLASARFALLASLSQGFRGSPGVIVDPSRPPQRAWAKELGVEFFPGTAALRLSFFRLDVRDERIQDPITQSISSAGRSVRQGFDADFTVPLGGRLSLTASGTFNDAYMRRSEALTPSIVARAADPEPGVLFHVIPLAPGDRVPGVSRYLGRAGLDLRLSRRLTGGALVRFNGPFTPIGEPTVHTRSYVVADWTGGWSLGGRWSIDWELQNLFNARYPEVRASGFLTPGAPRVLRAELRAH